MHFWICPRPLRFYLPTLCLDLPFDESESDRSDALMSTDSGPLWSFHDNDSLSPSRISYLILLDPHAGFSFLTFSPELWVMRPELSPPG